MSVSLGRLTYSNTQRESAPNDVITLKQQPIQRDERFGTATHHPNCMFAMLKWALFFLVVSIIAGIFGFTGISAASAGIAKILFFVAIVVFLVFLVLAITAGRAIL